MKFKVGDNIIVREDCKNDNDKWYAKEFFFQNAGEPPIVFNIKNSILKVLRVTINQPIYPKMDKTIVYCKDGGFSFEFRQSTWEHVFIKAVPDYNALWDKVSL